MNRTYVGIARNGQRVVFKSEIEPEIGTHGNIYAAVIGPFRTKRAACIMAQYGANNPHLQSVADAERMAKDNYVNMQTLYVASVWWRDNEPFITVAGNSRRAVERAAFRAMKDAATDAYNQSEPEDKRRVRDYMNEIEWSGVNAFAFDSIVPERVVEQYEEAYRKDADTVAHHPEMDYSDYEMLRDGRKDVIVYLPTF